MNGDFRSLKRTAIGAAMMMMAAPTLAGTRSCTSGMVTLNICRTTTDVAYCLPFGTVDPDGSGPLVAPSQLVLDAFATTGNYQSPAACTGEMVTAGICTSGQLGTQVAITKVQFTDLQIRAYVLSVVRRYRVQQAVAAAQTSVEAVADPDVGN